MKKLAILAAAAALTVAGAAFAHDPSSADAAANASTDETIASDNAAVAKDNTAIAKQHHNMAANRQQKARAKANGDVASQAAASAKLGANHVAVGEKKTEKSMDQTIRNNDEQDQPQ